MTGHGSSSKHGRRHLPVTVAKRVRDKLKGRSQSDRDPSPPPDKIDENFTPVNPDLQALKDQHGEKDHAAAINRQLPELWKIEQMLGTGVEGTVYLISLQSIDGGNYKGALKVAYRRDKRIEERHEVKVLKYLNMPVTKAENESSNGLAEKGYAHIIRLLTGWLALEAAGGSIIDKIKESPSSGLLPDMVRAVIKDSCEGLAFMHERGVIHRDVHPGNILVVDLSENHAAQHEHGKRYLVKIIDMGKARVMHPPKMWEFDDFEREPWIWQEQAPKQLYRAPELDNWQLANVVTEMMVPAVIAPPKAHQPGDNKMPPGPIKITPPFQFSEWTQRADWPTTRKTVNVDNTLNALEELATFIREGGQRNVVKADDPKTAKYRGLMTTAGWNKYGRSVYQAVQYLMPNRRQLAAKKKKYIRLEQVIRLFP